MAKRPSVSELEFRRLLQDIPLNYHAKMHVKELLKKPEVSNDEFYSLFAKESFGIKTPFLKAGVSHNASSGAYYFEWDEDVLVFPGLRVAAKTFDMHPLQRKLDITSGAARAFVDAMDGTGHHCMLSAEDVSLSLGKLVSQATGLRWARSHSCHPGFLVRALSFLLYHCR